MRTILQTNGNTSAENKVMNPDQFDRVVTAIVEGKYSWACVLILRFAGYNPAHYIPYRTYKRLIKGNRTAQTIEPPVANYPQIPEKSNISKLVRT